MVKNFFLQIFFLLLSVCSFANETDAYKKMVRDAAHQISYLEEYNSNHSKSEKFYIYFLGRDVKYLSEYLDENSNQNFSNGFLDKLNDQLASINSGDVSMFAAITDLNMPITLPLLPQGTSLSEKVQYLKNQVLYPTDLNSSQLYEELESGSIEYEAYQKAFRKLGKDIYENSPVKGSSKKYKILPFSVFHTITFTNNQTPQNKTYHTNTIYSSGEKINKEDLKSIRKQVESYGTHWYEKDISKTIEMYDEFFTNGSSVSVTGGEEVAIADNSDFYKAANENRHTSDNNFDANQRILDFAGVASSQDKQSLVNALGEVTLLDGMKMYVVFTDDQTRSDIITSLQELKPSADKYYSWIHIGDNGQARITAITPAGFDEKIRIATQHWTAASWDNLGLNIGQDNQAFLFEYVKLQNVILSYLSKTIGYAIIPSKFWDAKDPDYVSQMKYVAQVLEVSGGNFPSVFNQDKAQMAFAFKCGLWNGIIDEVKGIVDLGVLVTDYFTDPTKAEALDKGISEITWEKLWDAVEQGHGFAEDGSLQNEFVLSHQIGKDVIFVASFFIGIGEITAFAKTGKIAKIAKLKNFMTGAAQKIARDFPDAVRDFITKLPDRIKYTVAQGELYVFLKLDEFNFGKISKENVYSDIKWLDEGKIIQLEDGAGLGYLDDIKFIDNGQQQQGILVIVEQGDNIGFKYINTKTTVSDITPLVVSNMPSQISRIPSSGIRIIANPNKTTTVLGNYRKDIQHILDELNYPKTKDFDAKTGGYNVLNVPDELYINPQQFWDEFNLPFLDDAIRRGDDIALATKPTPDVLNKFDKFGNVDGRSGFGREYDYLVANGYKYDEVSGFMKKGNEVVNSIGVPTSLSSKLGGEVSKLENWLNKYGSDLGDEVTNIFNAFDINLGNSLTQEIFEDNFGRLVLLTQNSNLVRSVITIEKTIDGKFKSFKYVNGYNKFNQPNLPPLSLGGLTPDFSSNPNWLFLVTGNQKNIVKIKLSGKRRGNDGDFHRANQEAGFSGIEAPEGANGEKYVWHHLDDFDPLTGESSMQLVKVEVHTGTLPHTGSVKQFENYYGTNYSN